MKGKFERRVCLDLFAGGGRVSIRDSGRILPASPLLLLGIQDPFDRYIFCDIDEARLTALKNRVARDHADRDVQYVLGDSNANVARILGLIPQHSPELRVLTFCFADPS